MRRICVCLIMCVCVCVEGQHKGEGERVKSQRKTWWEGGAKSVPRSARMLR